MMQHGIIMLQTTIRDKIVRCDSIVQTRAHAEQQLQQSMWEKSGNVQ